MGTIVMTNARIKKQGISLKGHVMRMVLCCLSWLLIPGPWFLAGFASQSQAHRSGQSFANGLAGTVTNAAQSSKPQNVPGYVTSTPKESSLDAHSVGDAALRESRRSEAAQHLTAQAQERQSFKLDPDSDPLLQGTSEIIANPQKTLKDRFRERTSGSSAMVEELKTCEESGEEYLQKCSKHLKVVLKITPEHIKHVPHCPGHQHTHWQWHGFRSRYVTNTTYCGGCTTRPVTVPKDVQIASEKWIDGCTVLEEQVNKGLCRYVSAKRSEQDETRMIQGEPIIADHWEEHYQYACFKASNKSCAGLRGQGCYQVKSVCKQRMGNQCVLWEQTYSCKSHGKQGQKSQASTNKGNPFCLTGNCADTSYQANNEMMTVMSQMAVLREAQNDLRNYKCIFRGQNRWCTRNCLDFRDCCGSGKGWGVSIGLSHCDKQERELRTLRDKNRCVMVGTYCAERDKVFRTCLRKKTTFCCFGTKLARLIQENGRKQIRRSWGSSENPDCNGFSPEELSQMDFSTIDFSELFEDIRGQMVPKDQGQSLAKVSKERLQDNMTLMTKPAKNRTSIRERDKLREEGL